MIYLRIKDRLKLWLAVAFALVGSLIFVYYRMFGTLFLGTSFAILMEDILAELLDQAGGEL